MPIMRADHQLADQAVQRLAELYQIIVRKDWGEADPDAGEEGWRGGEWSLEELDILQQGVADLAEAMGGHDVFARNIGQINISQVDMKHRGLASVHGIRFTSSSMSIDAWTVVHELGHVWDARFGWRLSKALQAYTGGHTNWLAMLVKKWQGQCDDDGRWPGCNRAGYFYGGPPPAGSDKNFNRVEDFAESVAAYVYPDVVQARVNQFREDPRYRDLLYYADYRQTRRWAFIDGLIKGAIIVR